MYQDDLNIFIPFIDGVVRTLEIQCDSPSQPGSPEIVKDLLSQSQQFAIISHIEVSSTNFNGYMRLLFPEKTYLNVMGKMLGETFESIDDDIRDGICELLNIVFGDAKKSLSDLGTQIEKAIPKIIDLKVVESDAKSVSSDIYRVPFTSSSGEFSIDLMLQKVGETNAAV